MNVSGRRLLINSDCDMIVCQLGRIEDEHQRVTRMPLHHFRGCARPDLHENAGALHTRHAALLYKLALLVNEPADKEVPE